MMEKIPHQEEINELLRMKKQLLGPQGCSMESMKRNSWKAHCLHVGIVGIKALQEQTEREKGCEYCDFSSGDVGTTLPGADNFQLIHSDDGTVIATDRDGIFRETPIQNCPMCGRNLSD